MKKCIGITEPFWAELSEDRRFFWKFFSRIIFVLSAAVIEKTGYQFFDWLLTTLIGLFLFFSIEPQRTYSKLSPKLRKRTSRVVIFLGSTGVTLVGVAIILHALLLSFSIVYISDVAPLLRLHPSTLWQVLVMISFLIAAWHVSHKLFSELKIKDLIYTLPRDGLFQLLAYRRLKVENFLLFATMEISIFLATVIYIIATVEIVKTVTSVIVAT